MFSLLTCVNLASVLVFWQLQLKARDSCFSNLSAACAEPLEPYTCISFPKHVTDLVKYVQSCHQVLVFNGISITGFAGDLKITAMLLQAFSSVTCVSMPIICLFSCICPSLSPLLAQRRTPHTCLILCPECLQSTFCSVQIFASLLCRESIQTCIHSQSAIT